ncbi:MAG: F0F1 ATP synthase subunit A [Candidatus Gracilibacteria bacterium]
MESTSGPHILSVAPHQFAESGLLSYISNTVLSTWIFIGILIILGVFLNVAAKKESGFVRTTGFLIVKHLKSFFKPLLGHNLPPSKTLWFVGGIFLYILGANLYSLLLDWFLAFAPGFHNYLRPINSDINTTLGMAILVILISHLMMIRFRGVFQYVLHYIFHFEGGGFVEKMINVVVGWIHLIGEGVRVLSLSLRLFGNIFAGAVLLGVMGWLTAKIGVATIPVGNFLLIPFYFFEMFVGFIQAMVFAMLVSLYFEEASSSH